VLDAARRPVGIGVPGELFLGGKSLARGYHRRPELTAERFPPHPLRAGERLYATGDVVRWTQGGELEFLDRSDDQVKVRGFRVELGEIESRLANHPDVGACAVVLRKAADGLGTLVGYAVARPGRSVTLEGLRAHLGETLPDYMVPSVFVFLEELPLNPSGKVDRKALPAPDLTATAGRAFEAPASDVEEALARAWKNALGIERVDAAMNFFELGGHSLLLVRVHAELQKTVDPLLSIVDLFRYPTIRSLANHIQSSRAGEGRVEKGTRRGALRRAAREARARKR
jgi:acyl carrier protein